MSDGTVSETSPLGVELTRETSVYAVTGRPHGYRMRIYVSNYWNMDPNIFVLTREAGLETSDEPVYVFSHVASPADMEEYPAWTDGTDASTVRAAEIDLVFRSENDLNDAWTCLVSDQNELVRTLVRLCDAIITHISSAGVLGGSVPAPGTPVSTVRIRGGVLEIYNPDTELWYPLSISGTLGHEALVYGDPV